jgi:hypothetical protein
VREDESRKKAVCLPASSAGGDASTSAMSLGALVVALHPHSVVSLLEPSPEFVIEVSSRPNVDEVASPPRPIVLCFDNSPASQSASEGKCNSETILARIQSRETHPCHADKSRLLRDYLHVPQRAEQIDIPSRQAKNPRRSPVKQIFEREPAT